MKYSAKLKILNDLNDTFEKKNHDYGDSVTKTFKKYGIVSYITRMADKVERWHVISEHEARVDEDIIEVLSDLCNYAILCKRDVGNTYTLFKRNYKSTSSYFIEHSLQADYTVGESTQFQYDSFIIFLDMLNLINITRFNVGEIDKALNVIINICLELIVQEELGNAKI